MSADDTVRAEAEFTPTTSDMRLVWINLSGDAGAFDRWLASHDAEVCADVLAARRDEVAEALARENGRDWRVMATVDRETYRRFADVALAAMGVSDR